MLTIDDVLTSDDVAASALALLADLANDSTEHGVSPMKWPSPARSPIGSSSWIEGALWKKLSRKHSSGPLAPIGRRLS